MTILSEAVRHELSRIDARMDALENNPIHEDEVEDSRRFKELRKHLCALLVVRRAQCGRRLVSLDAPRNDRPGRAAATLSSIRARRVPLYSNKRHIGSVMALVLALALMAPAAEAQHRAPDFHGRDFAHFNRGEIGTWRGGHWVHDWHDGRFAWWWVVDPFWYLYPAPIYPYPTYVPPAVIVQQAPPVPTGMPPAQYWYYCDNPQGYYPYVASCNVPWRGVPVSPPPAAPSAQQ